MIGMCWSEELRGLKDLDGVRIYKVINYWDNGRLNKSKRINWIRWDWNVYN